MKKLGVVLIAVMLSVSGIAVAQDGDRDVPEVKEEKAPEIWCPTTRYTDNNKCSQCHTMLMVDGKATFGLKEIPLASRYSEKPYSLDIVFEKGNIVAYMLVKEIDPDDFRQASHYLYNHTELKKLIVEIHSPGGSVMGAWRIVGIIEEMRAHGIVVETRCYGLAASAGGILLIAGDIGSRFVAPHAEIMIHKVWQFSGEYQQVFRGAHQSNC